MKYSDMVPMFTRTESPHMKVQCSSCEAWISKGGEEYHVEDHHTDSYNTGLIIKLNDIWWRKRGT